MPKLQGYPSKSSKKIVKAKGSKPMKPTKAMKKAMKGKMK